MLLQHATPVEYGTWIDGEGPIGGGRVARSRSPSSALRRYVNWRARRSGQSVSACPVPACLEPAICCCCPAICNRLGTGMTPHGPQVLCKRAVRGSPSMASTGGWLIKSAAPRISETGSHTITRYLSMCFEPEMQLTTADSRVAHATSRSSCIQYMIL
jgi:hypothetical protein